MTKNLEGTAYNIDKMLHVNHMKRAELAQHLGFTSSAITQKFSGDSFTLKDVSKIADLFNVSVDSLLGRAPMEVTEL